jgi:hypothetical protein
MTYTTLSMQGSERRFLLVKTAALAIAFLALWPFVAASADRHTRIVRMPRGTVLTGYPCWDLVLVTPARRWNLQWREGQCGGRPTMSTDGQTVSAVRIKKQTGNHIDTVVFATYSVRDQRWTDHTAEMKSGTAAISPDGTRLALARFDENLKGVLLEILDIQTGVRKRVGPVLTPSDGVVLSWAPDGRAIAIGMNEAPPAEWPAVTPVIKVLNIESGVVAKIASGKNPAWSPSGEWIAYLDHSTDRNIPGHPRAAANPNRVSLVHPDGTRMRVLVTLPRVGEWYRMIADNPVWSPDSSQVLLNEVYSADRETYDILLLTVSNTRLKRIARDVPPVYGWAAWN